MKTNTTQILGGLLSLLLLLITNTITAQATSKAINETSKKETLFDEQALFKRLRELSSESYEGRRTGEKGAELARAFIALTFNELIENPLYLSSSSRTFGFKIKEKEYKGENVIAGIKGTDFPEKYIVISAHYDHLGVKDGKIYNGADDNASGVCALFAFAEYFKKNPPKHSVILAAFDAEEFGLQGAKHFVKEPPVKKEDIILNINMDMIGRNVNKELYVVGTRYNKELKNILKTFNNTSEIKLLEGHDGSDKKQNWTYASDHGPFHKEKIPFLYFGEEDHPDYHKHTDDFHKIDPMFYLNAVEVIIAVFDDVDKEFIVK
ncbi:M28 family peptidase [Aquimarina gracilis]|uniref:M28 family peptidase n=1 Tax=Aquimarina gracilis TaxID=874422 RepID=A0ABU5ZZJ1_9FLAO|nr:M28 family peptidase [Aquimarina gracilis]MEB3347334.1 M28 family peptidase [Aquimarina gracilis]